MKERLDAEGGDWAVRRYLKEDGCVKVGTCISLWDVVCGGRRLMCF
jgi:hypothetical protein